MALVFVQIARHLYQVNNFKVLNNKLVNKKLNMIQVCISSKFQFVV